MTGSNHQISQHNDAAQSLCNLGCRPTEHCRSSSAGNAAPCTSSSMIAPVTISAAPALPTFSFPPEAPCSMYEEQPMDTEDVQMPETFGTQRKNIMKPKDPTRDTSVSFEEMRRLMRVYGPVTCVRNRTPKESGKVTKIESIRRKFYRWFPDFNERFEKTADGWYRPKFGHEAEMNYREVMRKKDQDHLVKKRYVKRCHSKLADIAKLK